LHHREARDDEDEQRQRSEAGQRIGDADALVSAYCGS